MFARVDRRGVADYLGDSKALFYIKFRPSEDHHWENLMQPAMKLEETAFTGPLERLSLRNVPFDSFYEARTREDYHVLVDGALAGKLDNVVSVGRSGIYFNKCVIHPPADA